VQSLLVGLAREKYIAQKALKALIQLDLQLVEE